MKLVRVKLEVDLLKLEMAYHKNKVFDGCLLLTLKRHSSGVAGARLNSAS